MEYKTIRVVREADPELNNLAAEGWHVVSMAWIGNMAVDAEVEAVVQYLLVRHNFEDEEAEPTPKSEPMALKS